MVSMVHSDFSEDHWAASGSRVVLGTPVWGSAWHFKAKRQVKYFLLSPEKEIQIVNKQLAKSKQTADTCKNKKKKSKETAHKSKQIADKKCKQIADKI